MEIERKFVAVGLPEQVEPGRGETIRQAYLAVDAATEVRIRERAGRCTLTVKSGHGLERGEVDVPIERTAFDELWAFAGGRTIDKVRTVVDITAPGPEPVERAVRAEVDVYGGDLDGLIVIEVEFGDRTTADAFDPPEWFGTEVTGDPAWSNASLAHAGRPPD